MAQATMMGNGIPVRRRGQSQPWAPASGPAGAIGGATSSVEEGRAGGGGADGQAERSSGSLTSGHLIRQTNSPDFHLNDTKSAAQSSPAASPSVPICGNFPLHQELITEGEKKPSLSQPPTGRKKEFVGINLLWRPESKRRDVNTFRKTPWRLHAQARRCPAGKLNPAGTMAVI